MEKIEFEAPKNLAAEQPSKEEILNRVRTQEAESVAVEGPTRRVFESIRATFPRFIWEQVEYDIALIEDAAPQKLNPKKLETIALALAAERHERESLDSLTGLYTLKYEKEVLTDKLREQMANPDAHSFDNIVRLSIDMNGLKTVNDENGGLHEKGNEYLRGVAETLRRSTALQELQVKGADVRIARGYGDDFSIIIIGLPEEGIDGNETARRLHEEIKKTPLPADLLPMDRVAQKLGTAPEGFSFYASAGVGAASAEDAFQGPLSSKNAIKEADSPKRVAQKLMGVMIDLSERLMKEDKDALKKRLAEGSAADQYYLKVMSPRDQELLSEIDRLKQRITELERPS